MLWQPSHTARHCGSEDQVKFLDIAVVETKLNPGLGSGSGFGVYIGFHPFMQIFGKHF